MRERLQSQATYHTDIYMTLSADHSPASGKTVTVTRSKNCGSFAAASGAVTEISSGHYKLAANAADFDTLGGLVFRAIASGCDDFNVEYVVTAYDPFDSVRIGLTALPNANAEAPGGLYTRGSGAGQINQPANGQVDTNTVKWSGTNVATPDTAGYPKTTVKAGTGTGEINLSSGNVPIQAGTGTGQLDFTSGVVKANLVQILGTLLTETAGQLAAGFKKWFNVTTPTSTMNEVTLVDTTTTTVTATNLANAPTNGDFTATMKTSLNAATPSVTVSDKTGFSLTSAYDAAKTAATQTSVNAIPTNPLLTNDARLNDLDATISSRLAAGSYVAPDNADIAAIKVKTDQLHFTGSAGVEKVNSNAANEVLDALASDHNTALTIGALINLITGGVASAAAVWNYLVSSLGNTTTVGGWWNSLLVAIKAKTDTIGTTTLTAVSPVTASGNLALVQGDSYLAADGRSLDFIYMAQPSFIGAAALLRFTSIGANSSYNIGTDDVPVYYLTGTVLSATEVQFEMTSAQSARLPANINGGQSARFEVQITLSDASVITPTPLNQGKVSVSPQAAP